MPFHANLFGKILMRLDDWFFRYKIETATDDNVNVVYGQNEIKLHCVLSSTPWSWAHDGKSTADVVDLVLRHVKKCI